MNEWKEYKLGEVIEIVGGGTPKTSIPEYWDGEIPWLSIVDFNNGKKFVYKTEKTITEEGLENSSTKILNAGDIIISARGTVGAMAVLGRDMAFNQSCYGIKNIPGLTDKNYIYYLIKDSIVGFLQIVHGGVFDTITRETFNAIDIMLPPLNEQSEIASVLGSLDDKIDLLHRQNKTLEAMVQTLFRQWFIEESNEKWEIVKIGDFVKTNVLNIDKDYKINRIRYLDTGSLTEGKIENYQIFNISDAPSRARRIVKHNDILISTVRPNQKHYGILKHPDEDVIVSTGFCVITCNKIDPHFIYTLLSTEEMTEYLHSIAEGSTSTYPSLKSSDIENLEIQLPPVHKLKTFSEFAESIWNKIEYNFTQVCMLENLRDSLLQKLIKGDEFLTSNIGVNNEQFF
ncbi:MAG TPA: restriction endonuclease subunit S [Ignavibacteriales bacterium]|nr:restriction endonuclease subunit S [Ignavibacteriales bacterium]